MKVRVSPVSRLHPAWQYAWPIQSPEQLLYFAALETAGIGIAATGVRAAGGQASLWPLLAIALFVLPTLVRYLPVRLDLTVAEGDPDAFTAAVRAYLADLGYRVHLSTGNAWVAAGGVSRWRTGRDLPVRVFVMGPGQLRVEGPRFVLRALGEWAKRQED